MTSSPPTSGWLNLYKPEGISSFGALAQARRIMGIKKVGHAGTLDPLAEGVLPLAFGEATKLIPYLAETRKIYRFTLRFGMETSTDDREGEITERSDHQPEECEIRAILPQFTGEISQIPPRFAAIKINGERAYARARKGEAFDMPSRNVTIFSLTLDRVTPKESAVFTVECSGGTYIRALARDMARALGSCGFMESLVREVVGKFTIQNAISLEKLEELGYSAPPQKSLLPLSFVLDDILVLTMADEALTKISYGQSLPRECLPPMMQNGVASTLVQIRDAEGALRAMARMEEHLLVPLRVFQPHQ